MDTKGKHLAPSMRCRELHPLLCKAFSVFEKWPDNYFAFLDWRKGQAAETQPDGGLRKDFSGYKSALYTQLASSQLDFMRSAFEVYLSSRWDGGYTAHLRRLGDAASVHRRYASRREAKALLKVSAQGIDRLIAAGRLKAVVRPRKSGRLILIDRVRLQEFKQEIEQSLYLKQVETVLGIYRERIMELVDAGLLSPLRGPSVDGCSDWKFSQREVESLLVRVREKVRVITSGTDDTVSFFVALKKVARGNVGLAQLLKAILDGEIAPCGVIEKPGLAALLFLKAQVSDYARRQRHEKMGETYSAVEAAKLLGVTQDVVYFLTRKGILPSRSRVGERYPDLLIDRDSLENFHSAYILPAKVARKLGTGSGHLTRLLATQGIQPVSGPTVDGGKQYVFRKSDFDTIDINGLIPIRGLRNPTGRLERQ